MILCKLGSISDLSNFPTIQLLPIDRKYPKKPWKGRWANSKTNFHSIENRNRLQQEKLIFSCDWFFPKGALYHWENLRFFQWKSVEVNPQPQKQKHCNQGKTFLILILVCHCRHSFCFALSGIHKKILASVYERSYESSIIPPLKNRF